VRVRGARMKDLSFTWEIFFLFHDGILESTFSFLTDYAHQFNYQLNPTELNQFARHILFVFFHQKRFARERSWRLFDQSNDRIGRHFDVKIWRNNLRGRTPNDKYWSWQQQICCLFVEIFFFLISREFWRDRFLECGLCNRPENPSIGNRWKWFCMKYCTNRPIDGFHDLG
jgi:hypothetical protein